MRLLKAVKVWSSLLAVGKYGPQSNRCNEVMGWYVVFHPEVLVFRGKGCGQHQCVLGSSRTCICAAGATSALRGHEQVP